MPLLFRFEIINSTTTEMVENICFSFTNTNGERVEICERNKVDLLNKRLFICEKWYEKKECHWSLTGSSQEYWKFCWHFQDMIKIDEIEWIYNMSYSKKVLEYFYIPPNDRTGGHPIQIFAVIISTYKVRICQIPSL